MKYAIIGNGIVGNIAIADGPLGSNWVAIGEQACGIGWTYDGTTFTATVIPEYVAPVIRTLTKLEYMNRFTDAELAGIYTAAKSVIQVEIWLEKFKLASEIYLDDPHTVSGLQAMEASGLLAAGRAAGILAA